MGTTLIENRKRGAPLDRLTASQRMFVLELLADKSWNATEAARRAGYKNPSQAANKLLKDKKIKAILGKEKALREERTKLTSDQVWEYLHRVLSYNPLSLFKTDGDGWYLESLDDIPEEVGQMIEEITTKTREYDDGSKETTFHIRMVSKATALTIAAKQAVPDVSEHRLAIDWDKLVEPPDEGDVIEAQLAGG